MTTTNVASLAAAPSFPPSPCDPSSSPHPKHLDSSLELLIRKEYSAIRPQLDSLTLWVSNTLSEICFHDDLIYDFKVRTKTIESLLIKLVKRLLDDPGPCTCFSDVAARINDFVGGRIMVFVPEKLLHLNSLLLSMKRFSILSIAIHHPARNYRHRLISDIEKAALVQCGIAATHHNNATGYFGVHYVFKPSPCDEYYSRHGMMYDKFEIQARTIMQHAWSEIQHKLVYKSTTPNYGEELSAHFRHLARYIDACDDTLDEICEDSPVFAPSYKLKSSEIKKSARPLYSVVQDTLRSFESMTATDRSKALAVVLDEYGDDIEKHSKMVTKENVSICSEIAEMFLKGGEYDKAYSIYKDILPIARGMEKEGWICLRLAETCDNFVEKKEEAVSHIRRLEEILRKRDGKNVSQDETLCGYAATIAWKYDLKETSLWLGRKAVELMSEKGDAIRTARQKANLIYYLLEDVSDRINDPPTVSEKLIEIESIVKDVRGFADEQPDELRAGHYDSLGWFFYWKAFAQYIQEDRSALDSIHEAEELIEKQCYRKLDEDKTRPIPEVWFTHVNMIRELKRKIEEKFR